MIDRRFEDAAIGLVNGWVAENSQVKAERIAAALRSADEAGYRRGWESLADKFEDVANEFGDDPKAVIAIIGEWLGESRHAARSKSFVGEKGEK